MEGILDFRCHAIPIPISPVNEATVAGKVITFYSYKGGTGRSMALANVACVLARRESGRAPVLMVDWDLEAPGLHRFFPALSEATEGRGSDHQPGLIDLFCEIRDGLHAALDSGEPAGESVVASVLASKIESLVAETGVPNLHLLRAGRFDEAYATRINTFQWEALHRRAPGAFSALLTCLTERYSYVLLDSRTGYTDISGICTMLMPEKLVVVFTPNRQSLTGVLELIQRAVDFRRRSDDVRPLVVFPLLSRVEMAEPELRDRWRFGDRENSIEGFQPQFEARFKELYGLKACSLQAYFDEVQLQQIPRYAYGEEIAVLSERESDRLSLARSYEAFATRLIEMASPWDEPEAAAVDPGKPRLTRIGRYHLLEKMAEGGLGTLYTARDPYLDRTVALKLITGELTRDPEQLVRFETEVKAAASLQHPNIVNVWELGRQGDHSYIVTELLVGRDLRRVIESGAAGVTLNEKLAWIQQACSALAHGHRMGLIHRDVKPANVFVTESGLVKLLNFGLARSVSAQLTQPGVLIGSPTYMAPEVVRGERARFGSDVYSLGTVLYELLSLRKPFEADTPIAVMFKIINDEPAPIESLVKDLPPSVTAIVHRAMEKDPTRRFASGGEMAVELSRTLMQVGVQDADEHPPAARRT